MFPTRHTSPFAAFLTVSFVACAATTSPPAGPVAAAAPDKPLPTRDAEFYPGDFGPSEVDPSSRDLTLMQRAYSLGRQAADSEAASTMQADALADEAATFALLGDREEATALWLEAISLLHTARTDTLASQRPRKPPP